MEDRTTSTSSAGAMVCVDAVSSNFKTERERKETHSDCKDRGHAEEVVGVVAHGEDLGDDGDLGPVDAKNLGELAEVDRRGLTDGEDWVAEPVHAEVPELVVKELDAELLREEGDVLDNGLAHAPLLVLGEFDNRWEERS